MQEFFTKITLLVLGFLIPIENFIYVTLVLVLIDLVTGIIKNNVLNEHESKGKWWKKIIRRIGKITSKGLKRSFIKFTAYSIGILTASILDVTFLEDMPFKLAYFTTFYCALTEFASIFENLGKITGNKMFMSLYIKLKTKLNIHKKHYNILEDPDDEDNQESDNKS